MEGNYRKYFVIIATPSMVHPKRKSLSTEFIICSRIRWHSKQRTINHYQFEYESLVAHGIDEMLETKNAQKMHFLSLQKTLRCVFLFVERFSLWKNIFRFLHYFSFSFLFHHIFFGSIAIFIIFAFVNPFSVSPMRFGSITHFRFDSFVTKCQFYAQSNSNSNVNANNSINTLLWYWRLSVDSVYVNERWKSGPILSDNCNATLKEKWISYGQTNDEMK